ncbi:hypothetical protein RB614_39925 [Phytohabitans sp. ZYX-F-186]|uniref:Copper chaperone PCu(A)C n=1 Tax=Phytohabitans maris TaxID=3071409 RepID=A0ABU0ZUG5_9ACTN|nr:hypothetical protein [Phytohabitans sp. ZYX-F-186]MDQ7910683.1 hypothetical protein [Phytohabitans sp. ZYX-F-186]
MRRSMTLLAGAAVATALLASGCSAGQIAETAQKVPAVPGANGDISALGGSLSVRNAMVVYHSGGYETGADAPLDLHIFNDTGQPVTVTVTSADAESVTLATGAKGTPSPTPSPSVSPSASPSVEPTGTPSGSAEATGTPSASATPTAEPTPTVEPPAPPATVRIPAGSFAALTASGQQFVELLGLKQELKAGETVQLLFDFGGGATLTLDVPVGVPMTPVPRGSAEAGEGEH